MCVCVCTHVCIYVYSCVCLCLLMCVFMLTHVCIYVYSCVYLCLLICVFMLTHVCIYVYSCMCLCLLMCVFMFTHVCVYAYSCVRLSVWGDRWRDGTGTGVLQCWQCQSYADGHNYTQCPLHHHVDPTRAYIGNCTGRCFMHTSLDRSGIEGTTGTDRPYFTPSSTTLSLIVSLPCLTDCLCCCPV